ncbi:BQ2448_7910 [Microbotryum intermedium]|uniref:BQ2448_7910 protein n=1 Tax=Microbotryum intermedium TaxID=269621 RepID=A0A238FRP8_9BASI|nr:BQ2448_7910 [Microbotryum intermedium]
MRLSFAVCILGAVATTTLVSASPTKVHALDRHHRFPNASASLARSTQCGTTGSPNLEVEKLISVKVAQLNAVAALNASKAFTSGSSVSNESPCPAGQGQPITYVRMFWHQIVKSKTPEGGLLTNDMFKSQINAVNQLFSDNGIPFRVHLDLQDVEVIVDPRMSQNYVLGGQADIDFKKRLRRGGAADLNVYSVLSISSGHGGYGTYPWFYRDGNDVSKALDGVTLKSDMVGPDREKVKQNRNDGVLGKLLAHEILHWLGLMHTFEGNSCSGEGDHVADTHPQSVAGSECPGPEIEFQKSCPASHNLKHAFDNYDNIMDYTNETCRTKITCGQITRAIAMWKQWRAGK